MANIERKIQIQSVIYGNEKQSLYRAIKALEDVCTDEDILIIHDAARPLISQRIINDNIVGAKEYGAVDTVIPSADTIIRSTNDSTIDSVPVRSELYLGQTPQSFKYSLIKEAHEFSINNNTIDATDDCQLVLKLNHDVHLVNGDKLNFKVTTFEDLLLLKSVVKIGKAR